MLRVNVKYFCEDLCCEAAIASDLRVKKVSQKAPFNDALDGEAWFVVGNRHGNRQFFKVKKGRSGGFGSLNFFVGTGTNPEFEFGDLNLNELNRWDLAKIANVLSHCRTLG